jgi:hypothetical protein
MVHGMLSKPEPGYTWFRCVSPMWDNSARRKVNANIYIDSRPSIYKTWLSRTIERTQKLNIGDEQVVFINAWNEWAEGCHLEPDQKWGSAYLEATHAALMMTSKEQDRVAKASPPKPPNLFKAWYWGAGQALSDFRTVLVTIFWHLKQRLPPQ